MYRGYITLDNCTKQELKELKEELKICGNCKHCNLNFYSSYCNKNQDINTVIKNNKCNLFKS